LDRLSVGSIARWIGTLDAEGNGQTPERDAETDVRDNNSGACDQKNGSSEAVSCENISSERCCDKRHCGDEENNVTGAEENNNSLTEAGSQNASSQKGNEVLSGEVRGFALHAPHRSAPCWDTKRLEHAVDIPRAWRGLQGTPAGSARKRVPTALEGLN
jgi:hypothetical protein